MTGYLLWVTASLAIDYPPVGTCDPDPPPLECTETHLNEAPELEDAATCSSRADCPPEEFCGAGVCRPLEGATGTMCIERMWVVGTYCEDIRCISGYVLQDQVTTRQIVGAGKTYDAGAFECETSFHLCEPVDLGALVRHDNSVAMSLRQDESSLSHYHGQSDFLGGRELIRRWLDEPCMQFGGSQAGHHPDDAAVFAHVSLWYP